MAEWPIMLEFVMMTELGFLTLTGDRYQITIPAREPDIDGVRAAALKLAKTRDEDSTAYPEHFITAMPHIEAKQWQRRLSLMDERRRCTDQAVLFGFDHR
jgi:hypothetical protein